MYFKTLDNEGVVVDRGGVASPMARNSRSALGRTRTSDTRFRKPVLYPLSYEGKKGQKSWSVSF